MSTYDDSIAESVSATETLTDKDVTTAALVDSLGTTGAGTAILHDTAVTADSLALTTPSVPFAWGRQINDSLAAVLAVIGIPAILAYDNLQFTDPLLPKYRGTQIAQDSVGIFDRLVLAKIFRQVLAETLTLTSAFDGRVALIIQDYLAALETVIVHQKKNEIVADTYALRDHAVQGFAGKIAELLTGSDSGVATFLIGCAVADLVSSAESVTKSLDRNVLVVSTLSTADHNVNAGLLQDGLLDGFGVDFKLVMDGQVYQCWVLNSESLYPSIYTNYNFSSFVELDSVVYATDNDGIYVLEDGIDDSSDTITTGVKINLYNMGMHFKKRLYRAYFGVVGDEPAVKMITELGEVQYFIVDGRIKVVKGHEGREWMFNLTQVEAVDFIELTAAVMMR